MTSDPPARFRDELRPSILLPSLTQGLVLGILEVVVATSFAAFIFSGPLAVHLPAGIGASLFAAVAVMGILAVTSSLPGAIGSVQDSTAAVMAIGAAAIASRLPPEAPETFLTVILAVGVTTTAAGLFFLVLGTFRLGDLIRFVPYPVIGGFLAGTGWLIAKGAVGVLTGIDVSLATLGELGTSAAAARWGPGLAFAVILLVLLRRTGRFLLIPGMVIGGAVAFYVVLAATGTSIAAAESGGWLLGPFPEAGLWRPWMVEAAGTADWGAVLGQAGTMATVLIVGVLALLLNASGIELVADRDVDLNRELRAAGGANILAGAGGGLVGFHALSLTALAQRSGARSRLTGVVAALVCLVALLFGAALMSRFPRPVLGGLLLFLGLSFLVEWVIDAWSRLPRVDHAIVLLILVVIGAFGFLEGVALGLALAVVLFVVSYSRTEVVKHALTGETFTSNVDRSPREREILRSAGAGVQVFELQGFLFFGTANRLLDRIRARAGDPSAPPLRSLILDFRRVSGLDSSAVLSFTKAAQLAGRQGFRIALAGVPAAARRQLERGGVEQEGQVAFFEDTDRALQWHEDRILEEAELEADATATFRERLAAEMPDEDVETLLGYVERMEVPAGQELISQGGSSGDVFFLERGRLTARLRQPDGGWTRLRTMGSGTVVGEMAMYLGIPRSASVVAEEASVLYRLPDGAIGLMEERHPRVAAGLHRFFARLLSERLADTLRSLSALLD